MRVWLLRCIAWTLQKSVMGDGPQQQSSIDKRIGKPCTDCGTELTEANIIKKSGNLLCKPCFNARQRAWRKRTPEITKARQRRHYEKHKGRIIERVGKWAKENPENRKRINVTWRWRIRLKMIEAYGGKCACCGETEPAFLTIDHMDNDGYERRRDGEQSGAAFYTWLRDQGWPKDGYQLLCMNCNFAKGHFGECPHAQKRDSLQARPAVRSGD
jgi:hypothetical protein